MKIEIEKEFKLTNDDYNIIKEKCEFVSKKEIIDIYLDTKDYKIFNTENRIRYRNGILELKIKSYNKITKIKTSFEYDKIEEIQDELKKLGIKFEELIELIKVETNREKYKYLFNGTEFIIDVDKYKYAERYEIELLFDNDIGIDGNKLINDFRNHIGLTSNEQDSTMGKVRTTSKYENKELYKVISDFEQK